MGRTTINITGDAACAVVVSKMEDRKVARTKSVLGRSKNRAPRDQMVRGPLLCLKGRYAWRP